jgi:glycosyltransferase involved in cell wall biosynthesis
MKERVIPQISVVIPVFNEEKNVVILHRELFIVLNKLKIRSEIIFVDDGSTDNTFTVLSKLHSVKIIRLRRNSGQTIALKTGLDESQGEIIVTLDGDLQNNPKDIPKLLKKINDGYDLVNGWRRWRRDVISKTIPSKIANWMISKISGVYIRDNGCALKAFRRELISDIDLHGEMHRFIPTLAAWRGAKIAEIEVNHRKRISGISKYGISRIPKVILDLITIKFLFNYFDRPMRIFGSTGIIFILIGTVVSFILAWNRVIHGVPLSNRPLVLVGAFFVVIGFQFVYFGLLAEIAIRIYYRLGQKDSYIIKEILVNGKNYSKRR